jgi:hypothetical protein
MKTSLQWWRLLPFDMKNWLALCAIFLAGAYSARAGSITGTVRAQGKEGADSAAPDGKYASRKYKFAERIDYAELRDFVV